MSTYNNKYDILASTIAPNPASVKYWADLASNPNGGDLKYFDGKEWKYVNNQATSDTKVLRNDLTFFMFMNSMKDRRFNSCAFLGEQDIDLKFENMFLSKCYFISLQKLNIQKRFL